ncbi:aldo/keto reductase [Actinoplanes sp. NPDC089786]|uniref:aldo/keto reductase n=1 Tax=Actinoplanes sp. NPDC089786 TaxID=3155185 RepID=UPI00342D5C88
MKVRSVNGINVTELGFGGASVGNLHRATGEEQSLAAIDAAWAGGIRYFDTAPHYGLGLSERRLGKGLARRPRDEYVLSTKVGRLLVPNPSPQGTDDDGFEVADDLVRQWDFSRDGVRRSIDDSLERLGLDRIDIVYVHDPDDFVDQAIAEAIPALIELRDQGVIGAVGAGMNQWEAPLRMVRETDIDVIMLAGRWTLLDRSGAPLLAAAAEKGVSIVDAAPYNSGLLSKDRPPQGALFNYAPAPPELLARANELADVCAKDGVRLPDAALQFPLRSPQVKAVVCGMSSAERVNDTLARLAAPIEESTWSALDG